MSGATTTATTTPAGRLRALGRAELTLLGRSKGVLITSLFVPLVLPLSLSSTLGEDRLKGTGLDVGTVVVSSAMGFSLLFAVYTALVSVYAARREELVLKRLRTGELRDAEILAGAALPSAAIGLLQCLVLAAACAAFLDTGMPDAPLLALVGLALGFPMCAALAALTTVVSRSVESAQVAAMPLMLLTMFGSGSFVPLELLPDKLASICELLPLTPVLTLIRGGWSGQLAASDVLSAILTAVAWTVVAVFAVRRWFRWEPRR
ncbi:ABC transporter permease [Streptomyces xanthii]|uniref:Transport permease protein n=1 Tax=Streptomyces xanthii TaxID=2768069 RepID=A0A7H1B8S6_9ACTN|nr:ABC transporter permease [Streptomyces xanthii]QNS05131.1 ABC transporter permease [Streptomyces xanthii]